MQLRSAEYVEHGARRGWLLDPQSKTLWIYRAGAEPEARVDPASVSGEGVLPGLELRLGDVW